MITRQIPSRLAQLLDLPCATVIIELNIEGNTATAAA